MCYRCGFSNHLHTNCKYKDYKCNKCSKVGHLASVCRTRTPVNQQNKTKDIEKNVKKNKYNKDVHQIDDESDSFENSYDLNKIFSEKESETEAKINSIKPITETLYLNGVQTNFELDSGSGVSTLSKKIADQLKLKIYDTNKRRVS